MKKVFAANWKLFKTPNEARNFFENWKKISFDDSKEIFFFPTSLSLEAVSQTIPNGQYFGSQNSYFQAQGAFTGEISADHLKSLGGKAVLLGHSERRSLFSETDELIAKKIEYVQSLGLTPFFCIGESLAERDSGQTLKVLSHQLVEGLKLAQKDKPLVVAYEPVWAIGTGRVAGTDQVKEAHAYIRQQLNEMGFKDVAILYGGSVKPENAKELISIPNVNGFLVGGASLEVSSFQKICEA